MIKIERRSLFSQIFGGKPRNQNTYTRFELISSADNMFYAWDGNIFNSDIVRAAIRPKVNAISKLNPKHIRGEGENIKINPDARIREILQNPNPYMSMQDFLMKMTFQRELNHNAFAFIKWEDGTGLPEAVYPMPAASVELLERENAVFTRFLFRTGKSVVVPYEDIIHLRKDYNSHDFFGDQGAAALKPLMEVITTTDQGMVSAIKSSAVIRWLLKFKNVLKQEDIDLQVKTFVQNYLSITNETGAAATDPRYEVEQVKQDDKYIPNAAQTKESIQRLYSYFGVNEAIVQNKYDENQFNAFYESELEPIALQLSNAFTRGFFSLRERGHGNRIVFEASNLTYASMNTKLALVSMVDRGAMTPNQWRAIMNLGPIEGGDKPIRRLDTAPVNENNPDNDNNEGGEEDNG